MNYPPTPLPKPTPLNLQPPRLLSPEPSSSSDEQSECRSTIAKKEPPKGNILHVSNICPTLNYEQIKQNLYKIFSIYGPIYEIVIKTKESGQHFAFVDYPDIRDAEKAVQSAKKTKKFLFDRELVVNYCEDPRKNNDRKDQRCFLCHDPGHKAIKCPNKPELIKPKMKKEISVSRTDEEISSTGDLHLPQSLKQPSKRSVSNRSSSSSESECLNRRDKDYLRFLKMKKQILEKKVKKKLRKDKKRR